MEVARGTDVSTGGGALHILCVYNGSLSVYMLEFGDSFEALLSHVVSRWDDLNRNNVRLYYSIPDLPTCALLNERDFRCMVSLVTSYGTERVRVEVKRQEEYRPNGVVEVGESSNVERDVNLLPMFRRSENKGFKNLGWDKEVEKVGQKYEKGAAEFREALRKCALEGAFEYRYVKNDAKRVTAVCKFKESLGCPWNVHATIEEVNDFFYVRKLNNVHTCGSAVRSLGEKRMGSDLVASMILNKVRSKTDTKPIDILNEFKVEYGIEVNYGLVWNGVEKAKKRLFGDCYDSFDKLSWYVDAALRTNPGSCLKLEVAKDSSRFRRIFVSFNASIEGFKHCRPLLFLDGTHLKGEFRGQVLAAVGKDGDEGFFPLAFAVVDSENSDNWRWFTELLKGIISPERKVTFVSDRNPGLVDAIGSIFPDMPHAFCLRHLRGNLIARFKNCPKFLRDRFEWLLNMAAHAPSVFLYQQFMNDLLREGGQEARRFFKTIDPSHWANAFFSGNRYGEMTTNVVESFNNWILKERHLPIPDLVDSIRIKLMKLIYGRRLLCLKWRSILCPAIELKMADMVKFGRYWKVLGSFETSFEVMCNPCVEVDIVERRCSCKEWQLTGLPCAHGVACIRQTGRPISRFVERFFHVSSFLNTYALPIHPIPRYDMEETIDDVGAVLPPPTKRPPGRPRTRRYLSPAERLSRTITCSRCKKVGRHNRKTCVEPLD